MDRITPYKIISWGLILFLALIFSSVITACQADSAPWDKPRPYIWLTAAAIVSKKEGFFPQPEELWTLASLIGLLVVALLVLLLQVRTNRALKKAELRYRSLFDGIPVGIYRTTPEGRIIEANPAMAHLLGYHDCESLLGINAADLYAMAEDRRRWLSRMEVEGIVYSFESQFRRRDGTIIWLQDTARAVQDEKGRLLYFEGSLEDITERKRAERRIQVSLAIEKVLHEVDRLIIQRRPLEDIFRAACRGALVMDYRMAWVGLAEPDHTVRPVAHEGFEDDYLRSIRIRWDEAPEGRGPTGTAIRTGVPFVMRDIMGDPRFAPWREEALRRGYRSSAAIPLQSDHQVIGALNVYSSRADEFGPEEMESLLGFSRQLTIAIIHSRTYEDLERTRERLQAIFENAKEGIFLLQAMPDGSFRYVLANTACKQCLGVDITGKTLKEVFPENLAQEMAARNRLILTERTPIAVEEEHVFDMGRRNLRISLAPIAGQQMIVGIAQDITEEQERERHFQQIQRLESVGRLAGGVAHDFNNLVTVILGYAQLAGMKLPPDSPLHQDMEEIRKAAERASSLIRQLLAFSRRQILNPEPINLNAIISSIERLLRRVIGEHIEIRTKLAPELNIVMADPAQIEQVIMNLAVNARDAMPGGGKLILETANVELDQEYASGRSGVKPGRYAMLAVSDTGCGMSQEVQERAFEPFFTTKDREKGSGLGLSTVYGIVKQHGGNIWVYSELGKGTTFKIYLPVAGDTAEKSRGVLSESRSVLPGGTETILLVEDQEEVREVSRRALSELGYNVICAASGKGAMEILSSHSGPLDLLVTDVVMPGASGLELARSVTGLRPQVKILFMSGYSEEAVLNHGVIPTDRFLQKPFSPNQISRKVREVLDQPK